MKIENLIKKLRHDFPDIDFKKSDVAHWSPRENTVFYEDNSENLLHELGHAVLKHADFTQDIELLHIERDAWEQARVLAETYGLDIDDDTIENALDNYREWIHKRSLCPKCAQTGIQSRKNLVYRCINCDAQWQANDARTCGLKRRIIS